MADKKKKYIIMISAISIALVGVSVLGIFAQSRNNDVKAQIIASNYSYYLPYGKVVESDSDKQYVVVETENVSLEITTESRKEITNAKTGAAIIFRNGKDTDYLSGLYSDNYSADFAPGKFKGNCSIKEFKDIAVSNNKKSYEIVLPNAYDVLEMNYGTEWILMSLVNDKSMLRTYAGLELSGILHSFYTPDMRFVELFVNGSYEGTYMICEKINIDQNRLNISKAKRDKITGKALTGGYLMKTDTTSENKDKMEGSVDGKNFYFSMNRPYILPGSAENSRIKFRHTKYLGNEHFDFIKGYMQDAEKALFSTDFNTSSDNGYENYFEIEDIIKWYIVEEVFKNPNDPNYTATYMFKERSGKISFGPVWYFGFAAGNSDFVSAALEDGWYVRDNSWISRMFEDKHFADVFSFKWYEIRDTIKEELFSEINRKAGLLVKSAKYNGISEQDYNKEVENLINWLDKRIAWMDEHIELSSEWR